MKRLAIFIDGSENDRDSLRSAVLFAKMTSAKLDVHHSWSVEEARSFVPSGSANIVVEQIKDSGRDSAWAAYHEVCADYEGASWVEVRGVIDDAIRSLGLTYDAIIIERLSEEVGPQAKAFNTALFEIGAPVLITPPRAPKQLGRVAAVVWTGTSQSARAMRSSLPLLREAEIVYLMTNTASTIADPRAAEEYLTVQGVPVTHMPFHGSGLTARGRGRAIIQAGREIGCDLLVMGAFGNNGIDALFSLGRTTRKMVTAAPMPLLMHN